MRYVCLALIFFYQRFISPFKGFSCAHHQLHRGDTCSNAIKHIISEHSWSAALPLVSARFTACKNAADSITAERAKLMHNVDLPLPCDCAFDLPTPSGDGACSNSVYCNACWDGPGMKRRTRRIVILVIVVCALVAAYFYGSEVTKIEVVQISESQRSDSLMQKLLSRDQPSLRALIIVEGEKIYSETKDTALLRDNVPLILKFNSSFLPRNISSLELHDARFSAAGELVVLGQVLERVEQPKSAGRGKRFAYTFKSRWGF